MTLEEAEAKLAALEKPRQDRELAWIELTHCSADLERGRGDKAKLQSDLDAAQKAYELAAQAEVDSDIKPSDIAKASQAVLDLRGEAHTETNILKSGVASDA